MWNLMFYEVELVTRKKNFYQNFRICNSKCNIILHNSIVLLDFITWESHFPNDYIKEVWYNCSVHRSADLFIIEIPSHSHIKRKQPQIIFLQYICSATMINIVKKCLWKKIHEQNILSGRSDDSQSLAQNKYIVKKCQLQNNYLWLLPLIR